MHRANLTVMTGASVLKLNFNGRDCVGLDFAHRREALPVGLAGADAPQCCQVVGRGVTLVAIETVVRETQVQLGHVAIAQIALAQWHKFRRNQFAVAAITLGHYRVLAAASIFSRSRQRTAFNKKIARAPAMKKDLIVTGSGEQVQLLGFVLPQHHTKIQILDKKTLAVVIHLRDQHQRDIRCIFYRVSAHTSANPQANIPLTHLNAVFRFRLAREHTASEQGRNKCDGKWAKQVLKQHHKNVRKG